MAEPAYCLESGMPPKLVKDVPSGRINIVAAAPLLERIDEWRSRLRPIPNKSEAARLLIEMALDEIARREGK